MLLHIKGILAEKGKRHCIVYNSTALFILTAYTLVRLTLNECSDTLLIFVSMWRWCRRV